MPVEAVRRLLVATSIPEEVVDGWLARAPDVWLTSAPPAVLAGDLSLCHPELGPTETRAVARPLESGNHRLTVVARDRPGLLAATAGTLASAGFSITTASAATWDELALHAFTVAGDADWDELGSGLRAVAAGVSPRPPFRPLGTANVRTNSVDAKTIVVVEATDQIGLFAAICAWFADEGCSIESVHADIESPGTARCVFVVTGTPDGDRLAGHVSTD